MLLSETSWYIRSGVDDYASRLRVYMYMHVYLSTGSRCPSRWIGSRGESGAMFSVTFVINERISKPFDVWKQFAFGWREMTKKGGGGSINEHGRVSTYGEENRRRDDFRDPEQPFWRLVGRIKRRRRDFPGRSRLHASSVERKRPAVVKRKRDKERERTG